MRMGTVRESTAGPARPVVRSRAQADALVLEVLREHAESLLRVARRHSLCADDAQDAYQRSVEIFLGHAASLEAEGAHRWLHTVLKHEAMRVRAQRVRSVAGEDVDLDGHESAQLPTADEQVASFDLMARSAEALQRLKPQELRALWLRAQGHSYQEIADITQWTYTKVNRCITEGRRSFLDRYAAIGSGAECRRWEPVLSALVDGEASPKDLAGARPHLRNCPACRAHVRALREGSLGLAALLPVPVAIDLPDHGGLLARLYEAVAAPVHERVLLTGTKLQAGVEAALPGKFAVAAASAAAIGGGVAVERAVTTAPPAAKPASAIRTASPPPRPVAVREPSPPSPVTTAKASRPAARKAAVRRTAKSEFGLAGESATTAAHGTAASEFAAPDPGPAATVAASPANASAPIRAPAGATREERTAAAEFGGG